MIKKLGDQSFSLWHGMCVFGHVQLFATPWTAVCQAPLSRGFPRQEYWTGLPFPSPVLVSKPPQINYIPSLFLTYFLLLLQSQHYRQGSLFIFREWSSYLETNKNIFWAITSQMTLNIGEKNLWAEESRERRGRGSLLQLFPNIVYKNEAVYHSFLNAHQLQHCYILYLLYR